MWASLRSKVLFKKSCLVLGGEVEGDLCLEAPFVENVILLNITLDGDVLR